MFAFCTAGRARPISLKVRLASRLVRKASQRTLPLPVAFLHGQVTELRSTVVPAGMLIEKLT